MMVQRGTPPLWQGVLMQVPGPPVLAPVVTALPRVVAKGGRSRVERMMVQKGTPPLQRLLCRGRGGYRRGC